MSMTIQKYEDWMRPQVIELFNMEYRIPIDEFDKLFGDFYEHPFQREHCISHRFGGWCKKWPVFNPFSIGLLLLTEG